MPAASSGSSRADRLGHALHEPALAQSAGAEHHAAHAGRAQHAPQHHRGVRQIVDAAARQPRQPLQRAATGTGDHAGQVARLLAADRVVMHHLQRIAGLRHVDARQRAPRAADQIQIAVGALGQPRHRRQVGLGDRARAHRIAAGTLRQPDRAQAQRVRHAARAAIEPHQFQRTAADIGQDAVGGRDAAQHAHRREFRLLQARQNADRHVGQARLQAGDEVRAVARIAHRGGGEDLERRRAHRARHRVIAVQHGERLTHALFVQPSGRLQAAAEAQHRLLVEDRHRVAAAAPRRPRDAPSSIRDRPPRSAAHRQAA